MDRNDIERAVRTALNKKQLTLRLADALIESVIYRAQELGLNVVVAMCDNGGNTVALKRMDGAYIASVDIAINKAYTSVSLQMPTKKLEMLAREGGELYGIQNTNGGKIVIFGGGEPLYIANELAGGFGVSGSTLKNDTELGEYAKRKWEELICL